MIGLPKSTEFNKRIPKEKFYENLNVTPTLKKSFVDQIKVIYWRNKIAATTTNLAPGTTVTEIEVYDTEAAADPETGAHPVKARVRKRTDNKGTSKATEATERRETKAESLESATNGKTLDEVTVTASRPPSLWERIKQGAGWATALVILAAAGWIIYKLKKQKRHEQRE